MVQSSNDTAPTGRRKAYSYLRFSTPEQSKGDSFRRQTTMALEYARRHNLELDETLTFHDEGISGFRGKNSEAGQLAAFLEAVRVGLVPPGAVLLVEQLDRLSRQVPRRAVKVLEEIVDQGVSVVTLADGQEYTAERLDNDQMALIMVVLTSQRAHEESATKSRRLSQAWQSKRTDMLSRPLTGIMPAWLRLDRDTGQIETVAERAELVQRMFQLTLAGVGQHAIAETFNTERRPVWGRGKHWHRSYVSKILHNPAVVGIAVPHVVDHSSGRKVRRPLEPVHGYFPVVVSEETFNAVQALRPAAGRPPKAPELANVLGNLAACPKCGASMTRVQKGKKSRPALVCTAAKSGAGCEYKSVRYEALEGRLLRVLPGILREREGLEAVEWHEGEVFHAHEAVFQLQEEVENLLDALGQHRSPALLERLAGRENALQEARAELRLLEERRDQHAGPVLGSRIARAAAALEASELNRAEVNLALRGLFKRAVINWPRGTIDLEWSAGGVCHVHYGWTAGPWRPAEAEEVSSAA
jgi:DNA invertase Pin-like site-specific DNA recombinase